MENNFYDLLGSAIIMAAGLVTAIVLLFHYSRRNNQQNKTAVKSTSRDKSNDRIKAALAALSKATKAPWYLGPIGRSEYPWCIWSETSMANMISAEERLANMALITRAPDLAAEVIRLREEVARLKEKEARG